MRTLERLKEAREVTFKEDFVKGGKVLYAKDQTTAMNANLVEQLKAAGAKVSVKRFDQEKLVEAKKERVAKAVEAQKKANK